MFHAKLAYKDFESPLDYVDGGIFMGSSCIEPYAHRLLGQIVMEGKDRVAIIQYERMEDSPCGYRFLAGVDDEQWARQLAEFDKYPLDFAVLTIERKTRRLHYRASPLVSVPVYMLANQQGVSMDWDYARLLGNGDYEIAWDIALAHIAGVSTYGPETIVRGLYRATADCTLSATPAGVSFELPHPITHDGPQIILADARIETQFFEAVKALLEARPLTLASTALELSGGMDSALTALAAASAVGPGLLSIGAQFGGSMGQAQRERRLMLCAQGGFADITIPAERFAPFSPSSLRRIRYAVWPEDENYPEIFEALFALLRTAGVDNLVSGFGGDELYLSYVGEDAAPANEGGAPTPFLTANGLARAHKAATRYPLGWLQESCWQSAASQSQRLLRYGLWPIYPYHNLALARFISSLPYAYRQDRRLLRTTLSAIVGNRIFETDYIKENFDPVARRSMIENRDYLIDLVRRSPLSRHPDINDQAIIAALEGDIDALGVDNYNALFRTLKTYCFFQ